jgi:hypothetical protein
MREGGDLGILAFGKRTHRITAGEDTGQALLLVDDQHRAGTALPHAATGLLYRLVLSQQQRVLALTISASFRLVTSARSFETG